MRKNNYLDLKQKKKIQLEKIKHKIEMENLEQEHQLNSCCGTKSDKRLLVFISSYSIALFALFFSMIQLVRLDDPHSQVTYVGIMTMIIGLFIPSPISKK